MTQGHLLSNNIKYHVTLFAKCHLKKSYVLLIFLILSI